MEQKGEGKFVCHFRVASSNVWIDTPSTIPVDRSKVPYSHSMVLGGFEVVS